MEPKELMEDWITTYGDTAIVEQIMKQLHKIVTVIKVVEFADIPAIEREMMFVKVQAEGPMRGEILRTVEIPRRDIRPGRCIQLTLPFRRSDSGQGPEQRNRRGDKLEFQHPHRQPSSDKRRNVRVGRTLPSVTETVVVPAVG